LLKASLNIEGHEEFIQGNKKLIIFRIIQECLNNCLKHAQATELSVNFFYNETDLIIAVKDNGIGFQELNQEIKGIGLQNIINRASLIQGKAVIDSVVSKGTTITITLPYTE